MCVGGGVDGWGGGQVGVGVSGATYTNVKCGYAVCVFEPESYKVQRGARWQDCWRLEFFLITVVVPD